MEPAVLPAQQGWQWVLHGFGLFRAYAALWLLLLFLYWTGLLVLGAIPIVGTVASLLVMPSISAGIMVACRAVAARQAPNLRHIFEPLVHNRKGQLTLGLVYLAGSLLATAIATQVDGGALLRGPPATADRAQMMREAPAYLRGMATKVAMLTPTMMALWFAPALVHWRGMGPGKALFFSFFACLRNWRPFLVYGLGWIFFFAVVPMFLTAVLAAMLTVDMRGLTLISFILMPYLFAVMGAVVCSFYATYQAVFPEPEPAPPAPTAP
jgi:hypothetical protein